MSEYSERVEQLAREHPASEVVEPADSVDMVHHGNVATHWSARGSDYLRAHYGDDQPNEPFNDGAPQAQTVVLPRMVAPHNPGRRIFHDIRNERFPMAAVRPVAVDFTARSVHHRQYRWYFQGQLPRCTAYGTETFLAAAHPFNVPPLTPDQLYNLIVGEDHKQGRFFDGGATTVAAMEVGRQLKLWNEYRWLYTLTEMQQSIVPAPLTVGTNWYPSMWERGSDGIVKLPGKYEQPAGGHFYTLNGLTIARAGSGRDNLWRYPSTWGDGDYLIPDELMYRLLREDGEAVQPTELKLGADYTLPADLAAAMLVDVA